MVLERQLKSEETGKLDLSFKTFLMKALSGEFLIHDSLHEPFTYETWVRDQTIIEPLRLEYLSAAGDISWGEKGSGNFYDWMAEIRGMELTEDERSHRIHK